MYVTQKFICTFHTDQRSDLTPSNKVNMAAADVHSLVEIRQAVAPNQNMRAYNVGDRHFVVILRLNQIWFNRLYSRDGDHRGNVLVVCIDNMQIVQSLEICATLSPLGTYLVASERSQHAFLFRILKWNTHTQRFTQSNTIQRYRGVVELPVFLTNQNAVFTSGDRDLEYISSRYDVVDIRAPSKAAQRLDGHFLYVHTSKYTIVQDVLTDLYAMVSLSQDTVDIQDLKFRRLILPWRSRGVYDLTFCDSEDGRNILIASRTEKRAVVTHNILDCTTALICDMEQGPWFSCNPYTYETRRTVWSRSRGEFIYAKHDTMLKFAPDADIAAFGVYSHTSTFPHAFEKDKSLTIIVTYNFKGWLQCRLVHIR